MKKEWKKGFEKAKIMQNLKETLESFSLSEDTRRKILNEDHLFGNQGITFIPSEFKEIAQITLAGHLQVSARTQQVTVQPTCVEFYYHEEAEGGIKDPIVYHRNPKSGSPPRASSSWASCTTMFPELTSRSRRAPIPKMPSGHPC